MESKRVFVWAFLVLFVLASFSLISASNLEEFLSDDVTQLAITITQESSQVNLLLDTSETSFDNQEVILSEPVSFSGLSTDRFNFRISELLNGFDAEVEVNEGNKYPTVNEIDFLGNITFVTPSFTIESSLSNLFNALLDAVNINLNVTDLSEVNGYLSARPSSTESIGNIVFTKDGPNYLIWTDKGFEQLSVDWKSGVRETIKSGVESINIENLFISAVPFLSENNVDSSLFEGLDLNYTVGEIDLPTIVLKDGTYIISVPITANDGTVYSKNVTLILENVSHEDKKTVNETYIPLESEQPEVAEFLVNINGLGVNGITVVAFDSFGSSPEDTDVLKFFDITVDTPTSAQITFKIKDSDVNNPEKVSLYRLVGDTWTELDTEFTGISGGYHFFTATTPGFSIFAVAEEDEPSSGGRSGGFFREQQTEEPISLSVEAPEVINLGDGDIPEEEQEGFFASITGAVIGSFGTTGSLVAIVFVLCVVALAVVLRLNKRINEKSDKRGL